MARLDNYLARHAAEKPEHVALICGSERVNYSQLYERVKKESLTWESSKGKAVIVKSSQTIDFIITYFAVHMAGKIIVPLESDLPDTRFENIKRVVEVHSIPEDISDILFTTGTTGRQKGVMISHKAIIANAENLISFSQNEQLKGLEFLSPIIDAMLNHQPLEIEYVSITDHYHLHLLHPYFVKQYNGRWFLFGLDEQEERIKNLALDRIRSVKKSDHAFRKNETVDFNSYFDHVVGVTVPNEAETENVLLEIRLKFSPRRFKYVISKPIHKSQTIVSEEDGIISLHLYHSPELEQQIFSFGPDVEVLSPASLREEISRKIALCLEQYTSKKNS